MKVIKDIRLFIDRNNHKDYFDDKKINLASTRIAMKLREFEFSLGDFDHLYIVFTTNYQENKIVLDEKEDRYFPWFRYCYIGVSEETYQRLDTRSFHNDVIDLIEKVLLYLYGKNKQLQDCIHTAIKEAQKGEDMLMKFKEKQASKTKAIIYLRLLDNASFLPLLCVYDDDGKELLHVDLPETLDLSSMGNIQLSRKKVTVHPRKSSYAADLKPITFLIDDEKIG